MLKNADALEDLPDDEELIRQAQSLLRGKGIANLTKKIKHKHNYIGY